MLDTAYTVETPDGVEVTLRPAGPAVRGLAFLVDLLLRGALFVLGSVVLGGFGSFGTGLVLLWVFVLFWGYGVLCEQLWSGQTPGKRMFRLRTLMANGTPVTWSASVARNLLLMTVDLLPTFWAGAAVSMAATRRQQRIGDLVAGTVVVHAEPARSADRMGEVSGRRPVPVRLGVAEQQLLLAFAERSATLSPARRAELAALSGLTAATGAPAVDELLQMAHGLAGSSEVDAAAPPATAGVATP